MGTAPQKAHLGRYMLSKIIHINPTCERYEKYYSEAITKNKNAMVAGFRNREFGDLNDLLAKNESLEGSFFQTVVQMSKLHSDILKSVTSPGTV